MKPKRLIALVLLVLSTFSAAAQINITNVPKTVTLGTNDYVLGLQGGTTSRLFSAQSIATLAAAVASTNSVGTHNMAQITNLLGNSVSLLSCAAGGGYQMVTIRYNENLTPTNALVLWPDGTYGVWTATNLNSQWFTADGYTLTYTNGGKTIAQPTVSRDENGNVTNSPALVLAP